MQQLFVNELIPHPRNNDFFDDIQGEKWQEFLESIRNIGIIEPIIISTDNVIVSGHQRIRACKELGIEKVWCDVHTYKNEDEILQALIETNIRQRGDVGGSAKKVGNRIKELERIKGVRDGSLNEKGNNRIGEPKKSADQKEIADMLGMSVDTLQNYKKLSEMIPELDELVETGIVTKTTALAIMKELSEEEQKELVYSIDKSEKVTKSEIQYYINQIKNLEEKNKLLVSATEKAQKELKERPTVEVEREVIPKDYEALKHDVSFYKNNGNRLHLERKEAIEKAEKLEKENKALKEQMKSPEYQTRKEKIECALMFCAGVSNFLKQYGGYAFMKEDLENIPDHERKGYVTALHNLYDWTNEMIKNVEGVIEL